jgi:hypothetical protein
VRGWRSVWQAWKHDWTQLFRKVIYQTQTTIEDGFVLTPRLQSYVDLYLSTQKDTPAFVGDLSIVVHSSNKTRLSCANFTLQGTNLGAGRPGPAQSSSPIPSSPPVMTAGPPTVVPPRSSMPPA